MGDGRAWIVYVHDATAVHDPGAPPCACGATTIDRVQVEGIYTPHPDQHATWSGHCLSCGACGNLYAPRVRLHQTPRPGHRRRTR